VHVVVRGLLALGHGFQHFPPHSLLNVGVGCKLREDVAQCRAARLVASQKEQKAVGSDLLSNTNSTPCRLGGAPGTF
jgi:hypothetical protein